MAKHKCNLPIGVHRVRRPLVDGKSNFHFYIRKTRKKFWQSERYCPVNDEGFYEAYASAVRSEPKTKDIKYKESTNWLIDEFLVSTAFSEKSSNTQGDYKVWTRHFRKEFGEDPYKMFEEWESAQEVYEWRQKWIHSPRQYDYAASITTLLLNWAVNTRKVLRIHYCHDVERIYKAERSEILWLPNDLAKLKKKAPKWLYDATVAGCETGLRASDLVEVGRANFHPSDAPRFLKVKTHKRNRTVLIPITKELRRIIEEMKPDQETIVVGEKGEKISARWLSQQLAKWRRVAGVPVSENGKEKTLNDTRGTAATRLLRAGAKLGQIAGYMGWSLRYAANVIEHYAAANPEENDELLNLLEKAKKK